MTILLEKQYRTCDGREVQIYATNGAEPNSIHGAVKFDYGWEIHSWDDNGVSHIHPNYNLIEVKPRIQCEYWVNVYPEPIGHYFGTKYEADKFIQKGRPRLACVKVVIDCEEGEGL